MTPGFRSEVDAGLAYDVTRNRWGEIDRVNLAWRPFIRTATAYEYAPAEPQYYWYPGEDVTLTYEIVRPGYVKLTVSGAGKHYEFEPLPSAGMNLRTAVHEVGLSLDQSGRKGSAPFQPPTGLKAPTYETLSCGGRTARRCR